MWKTIWLHILACAITVNSTSIGSQKATKCDPHSPFYIQTSGGCFPGWYLGISRAAGDATLSVAVTSPTTNNAAIWRLNATRGQLYLGEESNDVPAGYEVQTIRACEALGDLILDAPRPGVRDKVYCTLPPTPTADGTCPLSCKATCLEDATVNVTTTIHFPGNPCFASLVDSGSVFASSTPAAFLAVPVGS